MSTDSSWLFSVLSIYHLVLRLIFSLHLLHSTLGMLPPGGVWVLPAIGFQRFITVFKNSEVIIFQGTVCACVWVCVHVLATLFEEGYLVLHRVAGLWVSANSPVPTYFTKGAQGLHSLKTMPSFHMGSGDPPLVWDSHIGVVRTILTKPSPQPQNIRHERRNYLHGEPQLLPSNAILDKWVRLMEL